MDDPIGGAWLVRAFGLELTLPLAVTSGIGTRRTTQVDGDGRRRETYVESMRPAPSLRAQLTFHLKHEPANLELLHRLFAACPPAELTDWLRDPGRGAQVNAAPASGQLRSLRSFRA